MCRGGGEGTWVWGGEGGAHGCVGVEGEGQTGVEGWRERGTRVCRGGGGGAHGCVGVEGEGHMGV